ncbi:endo-1,C4-beta-glucanase [Myxococcus landrumensis]|uniref:Endo-1,C4-beta-glucanase n=1 Tax=Myxococcus landrumensis TaxID=2813577 RepID=A0ABX7NCQ5_9BACT|nr:endo-1,C4-beta-glucanase [Myxococcus landrumus]QSQ14093.1 endo-1,C4-beta-glucanase [Myxococcus landrumus]
MKRIESRTLLSGVVALVVSGVAAANVVILNPGELRGAVSFGTLTLDSFSLEVRSGTGLSTSSGFQSSPYSLMVESGEVYQPTLRATVSVPGGTPTQLHVSRTNVVAVDNQNGPTTLDFNFPVTSNITASLTVLGGTIDRFEFSANAGTGTEGYKAGSSETIHDTQTAVTRVFPMIPTSEVHVGGTAYLRTGSGTPVQHSLSSQVINMLQGQNTASWTVDLSTTGHLAGIIDVAPGVTVAHHKLYYRGVVTQAGNGPSGERQLAPRSSYDLELPPGQYDVYLRTVFLPGIHYSDSKSHRLTITTGATTSLDFADPLGTARVPLLIGGMLSNADLTSARMSLIRHEPLSYLQSSAVAPSLSNGLFEFLVPHGTWRRGTLTLTFEDTSNPAAPLNASVARAYHSDNALRVPVPAFQTVDLSTEVVPLVRTKLYLDVQEPDPAAPEVLFTYPSTMVTRIHYSPGNDGRWDSSAASYGDGVLKSLSALTLIAEPGTYKLQASVNVNGSSIEFGHQYLTIAPPALTPSGSNVSVTPINQQDLVVNVTFPNVTSGGLTTVVESPLAPELPQGLKAFCADGASAEGIECSPLFYEIDTTAQFTQATVCIRRKFQGTNALSQFLRLYHYDKDAPPNGQWEELPPPPGQEPAFDCSENPQTCGCVNEAACGINPNAEPPISVIRVCGVTTGFSPFAIVAKPVGFTNTVNGVEYTGPLGPPALQTWTAEGSGKYRITATGASGASAAAGLAGGCGAKVSGVFTLQANDTLHMLVGQKGTATTYSAGGGGGSFVTLNGNPLLIAGGGGGLRAGAQVPGRHGSTGTAGTSGSTSATYASGFIAGGTTGQGGARATAYGAGGGGWSGNGASDGNYGEGGFSFQSGGKGGAGKSCGGLAHGGYGGGGAGNGCYGGGGGGGYSGGGGGRVGGGGGSLNTGTQPKQAEGACTPNGHGFITIEPVSH